MSLLGKQQWSCLNIVFFFSLLLSFFFLKVRQWIADRVSMNSSPVSPSTSTSYPGSLLPNDWSTPRREKSSPLRGPHGKFVSPSSIVGYNSSSPGDQATPQRHRGERHTDMAELAKHVSELKTIIYWTVNAPQCCYVFHTRNFSTTI